MLLGSGPGPAPSALGSSNSVHGTNIPSASSLLNPDVREGRYGIPRVGSLSVLSNVVCKKRDCPCLQPPELLPKSKNNVNAQKPSYSINADQKRQRISLGMKGSYFDMETQEIHNSDASEDEDFVPPLEVTLDEEADESPIQEEQAPSPDPLDNNKFEKMRTKKIHEQQKAYEVSVNYRSSISNCGIGMMCNVYPETLTRMLVALCPNITSSGIQFATTKLPFLELMNHNCPIYLPQLRTQHP
ncbi:unnamed protein product [Lactuca saligna]|uniref:Uncharacterized protein n=1 Tax=Lactuca saligna TaxID=75948 RepID=A0AA35ZM97_LACSI|nr:unnamed protein product [Lactuca saligna]